MRSERNLVLDGDEIVASVHASRNDNGEAERLARLFAAAPDMLAALTRCKELLEAISDIRSDLSEFRDGCVKQARAAIAKAEPKP